MRAGDGDLEWTVDVGSTPVTRLFNAVGAVLPTRAWRSRRALAVMSGVAGLALRAGRVRLTGLTPNGQRFVANELMMWVATNSKAIVRGIDLGEMGPAPEQAHLRDFAIPQRGLFVVGVRCSPTLGADASAESEHEEDGAVLEIVTERLLLRPLQLDDVPAFAAYRSDPDVARYQSWDTTYSPADAERLVASQHGVAFGHPGVWMQLAAVDRGSGALCGDCALRMAPDQPRTAEVGVTFAPAKQGSGLATEALGAVVTWLFDQHDLHRVYAQADDRNLPVHRLLERLGFRCEARLVEADWFKSEWATLRIYATLRGEWRASP